MVDAYVKALQQAQEEKRALEKERAHIEQRILHLRQTIATLFRLTLGQVPNELNNKGLTETIREIIDEGANRRAAFPVRGLKELLQSVGYDFSEYQNPLASITGTLERLVANGEIKKKRVAVPTFKDGGEGPTRKTWFYYSAKMPMDAEEVEKEK